MNLYDSLTLLPNLITLSDNQLIGISFLFITIFKLAENNKLSVQKYEQKNKIKMI